MYTATILAQHIRDIALGTRPAAADERALACILDCLAAAVCGFSANGPSAARLSSPRLFGSGTAVIWMSGHTAAPVAALLCNANAASALDIDDGHRAARGHPGACVIPTVLTLAGGLTLSGADLLSAIVAGYDIGVRIAASQNPDGISTRQSGRWAAFAAVAAAGSLLRAKPAALAHALAIAGVLAPNQQANGSSGYSALTGNDVKEGIAWSAATGLTALHLAMNGHSGPVDLFDHLRFYDRNRILDRLGDHFEIVDTYFKPYACCRYIHAPLDAFLDLIAAHNVVADEIVAVTVNTFGWMLKLSNTTAPDNLVDIQYSLPYCLAIAAIDGPDALAPVDVQSVGRLDLKRFAEKVAIHVDSDLDQLFPADTLASVSIDTNRGRFQSSVTSPRGDPKRPLTFQGLERKFRQVTRDVISTCDQQCLVDSVLRLRSDDGVSLLQVLTALRPR